MRVLIKSSDTMMNYMCILECENRHILKLLNYKTNIEIISVKL